MGNFSCLKCTANARPFQGPARLTGSVEKKRRKGYKLPPYSTFYRTEPTQKRLSALGFKSDGLSVSAQVRFKKDRQKYRQIVRRKLPDLSKISS
jgi:hypothetical protein